jgi:NADH-ubiquinone oxidoreductase chain 1
MCILSSALFVGGYLTLFNLMLIYDIFNNIWIYLFGSELISNIQSSEKKIFIVSSSIDGLFYSLSLGLKSSVLVFIFIWVRASFPRIRFDQLISFCWTVLLPIVFAFVILIPCILYDFNIFIANINIF